MKKKHGPKNGAAKKWSERLEKLGEQPPPKNLTRILFEMEQQVKGNNVNYKYVYYSAKFNTLILQNYRSFSSVDNNFDVYYIGEL